jgi:hypothetical protein
MEPMLDLAVDVRRITVRLLAGLQGPVEAVLFLPPSDPRGPSGLLGRLNDDDAFVPASIDGSIRLLAKSALPLIGCPEPLPEIAEFDELGASRMDLRLRMRGGAEVSGTIRVLLPDDRRRLSDFLNHEDRFFALSTESGDVVANKDWIESVEPRGGR